MPDQPLSHQALPNQARPILPASRSRPQARDLHPILVKGDPRRHQKPPAEAAVQQQDPNTFQASWDAFDSAHAPSSRCRLAQETCIGDGPV